MWDNFPGPGLSAEGARPKRPEQDAPTKQPMRAGIKPADRKQPTGDQKKVRRQMSRQAATVPSASDLDSMGAGEVVTIRIPPSEANNGNGVLHYFTKGDDGRWCKGTADTRGSSSPEVIAAFQKIDAKYNAEIHLKELSSSPFANGGHLSSTATSTTTTKESTMTDQSTEAVLLTRLASATTFSEQTDLQNQIESIRSERREHVAASESLDWDGLGALPPSRMQAAAANLMSGHLPPASTASTRLGHTEATDWLMDATASHSEDAVLSATARAEATLWYEGLWDAVKQTPQEFSVQAKNASVRSGIQFGLQSTAASSVFMQQVAHLASRDGIALTVEAAEYAGGSPKSGDSAKCHKDGGAIQFFDGQWMHLKGTGSDHNDVHPNTPKEQADADAKESSRHHALETTVDTYVSDGKTTQPVGVSPSHAQDTMDEWGIGSDANGTSDPKSTTSTGDAPSLAEGDAPETGSGESLDNPNYGQTGQDKSTFTPGNTDDLMKTQGGLRICTANANRNPRTAIAVSNVGIAGPGVGSGTTADGTRITFLLTPEEEASLKSVLYSDLAVNFTGVDIEASDILTQQGGGNDMLSPGRAGSLADRMAAEFGSTMGRGIERHADFGGDGLSSADAPTDAPSLSMGDSPETGHAEAPTQDNGVGAQDLSGPTESDRPEGGVNWTSASLSEIGRAFRGKQVSPNIATFAAALEMASSISDSVGGVSVRRVASLLAASDEVPAGIKSQLAFHLAGSQHVAVSRPLYEIAADIKRNWNPVYFGAVPYLDALGTLSTMADSYYEDDAATIVHYLLSNMGSKFKGPEAARLKAELKVLVGRSAAKTAGMTCSVCGDAIAKDPSGEDPSTYHHDNGEKHDHEAKPGAEGDSESKEAAKVAGEIPEAFKKNWDKGGDGETEDKDADNDGDSDWLEKKKAEGSGPFARSAARDTGTCGECGRAISYDGSGSWYHDNEGEDTKHPAKKAAVMRASFASLLRAGVKVVVAGTSTYCPNHGVYVGEGNQEQHDHCKTEQRETKDSKVAAGRGNDFSISDAKNEDGEWVMSPEQIRAEMAYDPSEDGGDPYYEGSRKQAIEDAGLGVGHIWTNTQCPAYTSLKGADCTCDNKPKSASRKQAAASTDKTPGRWVGEVGGVGESVWSRNSMTYDTEAEAKQAVNDLSGRWFGMDIARVRQIPEGGLPASNSEQIDPSDPSIVLNYR